MEDITAGTRRGGRAYISDAILNTVGMDAWHVVG